MRKPKVPIVYIASQGEAFEGACSQATVDAWLRHPWEGAGPDFWIATPWGFWPLHVLVALTKRHSFAGVRPPCV